MVELYHYTEDPDEFVLFMEYCNDANYLERKIETVSLYSMSCGTVRVSLLSRTKRNFSPTQWTSYKAFSTFTHKESSILT